MWLNSLPWRRFKVLIPSRNPTCSFPARFHTSKSIHNGSLYPPAFVLVAIFHSQSSTGARWRRKNTHRHHRWIERKNLIYKIELAVGSSANVGEKKWKLLESSKIQSSMSCGISARRPQLTSSPQFIEISSLVRCLPSLSTLFFSFNTQWVFG